MFPAHSQPVTGTEMFSLTLYLNTIYKLLCWYHLLSCTWLAPGMWGLIPPGWFSSCSWGGRISQGKTSKPTREQTGKGKWGLWDIPCFKFQSHRIMEQFELEGPLKTSSPIPTLMSRTWTTRDCSEPCPMWPSSGFSAQRGWGKPFQREESILSSC